MKRVSRTVRITYDRSADAAYIDLMPGIAAGAATKTCPCDPGDLGMMVYLDLNAEGRLLGIEVLGASAVLPQDVLEQIEAAEEE